MTTDNNISAHVNALKQITALKAVIEQQTEMLQQVYKADTAVRAAMEHRDR